MLLVTLLACRAAEKGVDDPRDPEHSASESGSDASVHTGEDTSAHTGGDTSGETGAGATPALVFTGRRPTNLLVISLDTTRRDQLGVFSGQDTTPFWDTVLAEGFVLADHRSCSNWTAPSMLCATTSRFPLDDDYWPTSVYNGSQTGPLAPIPDGLPTLASILGAEGFSTALVTANGVFSPNNCEGITHGYQSVAMPLWQPAPVVVNQAVPQARALVQAGSPWFLHIHFIDPHTPYVAPTEYLTELDALDKEYQFPWDVHDPYSVYTAIGRWGFMSEEEQAAARLYLLAVYRAELRYWDASVADLWSQLEFAGALDDTLVVFWTDHGEQHGEHGSFFHGVSLYAQENRSTAAFWARNLAPGEWTGPTIHQDIVPTVLDALGLPPDPDAQGTVLGLAPDDRVRLGFNFLRGYSAPLISVTQSQKQLIYYFTGGKFYFDLATDPEGDLDLYDAKNADVVHLWSVLGPEVTSITTRWPAFVAVDARP